MMVMRWPDHSWYFSSDFSLLIFLGAVIMIFHGVDLLHCVVELDGFGALVAAAGTGLIVFEWPLHSVLFGVVLKQFSLFGRVPGTMHQACLF